jgi:hypothetical protein
VFDKKMVRRMFGPKREGVAGGRRRLYNELHNLYTSLHIIRVIKSRRIRWAGHVTYMGKVRNLKFLVRKPKGRDHSENLCIHGRIILGWKGVDWMSGLGLGSVVGSCEHDNEPLGSIKDVNFLTI